MATTKIPKTSEHEFIFGFLEKALNDKILFEVIQKNYSEIIGPNISFDLFKTIATFSKDVDGKVVGGKIYQKLLTERKIIARPSGKYIPPNKRNQGGSSQIYYQVKNSINIRGLSEDYFKDSEDPNDETIELLKERLKELFNRFGMIQKIHIPVKDVVQDSGFISTNTWGPTTKQCRGFAFIDYYTEKAAASAVEKMNGYGFEYQLLKVDFAKPKTKYF